MKGRDSATAVTRRRIVEATLELHGEKGIFGTTWQDIAGKADVAIGTVYRHFRTLDELVPACGELLMQRTQPPSPQSVREIIGDAEDPAERLFRVAAALFAFYHRGGRYLESDLRERELPAVREWEAYLRTMVTGFLAEALADCGLSDAVLQRVSFMLDFPTYSAMRVRGVALEAAARMASEMVMSWLRANGFTPEKNRRKRADTTHSSSKRPRRKGESHDD